MVCWATQHVPENPNLIQNITVKKILLFTPPVDKEAMQASISLKDVLVPNFWYGCFYSRYFYGTRLYREDFTSKGKKGSKSVWQVICFTEDDWFQLAKKLKKSPFKGERQLSATLTENFLPELPRLFHEKENLARKRLLESLPRRTSSRLEKKVTVLGYC